MNAAAPTRLRVIAVCNRKGGAGKTTTVVNLAAELAHLGWRVLLLNALSAATWVLVPFVPHPLSYEGVRQLMRVLFRVMSRQNPELKLLGFLPMMAADHIRQHRAVTGDVARQYGAPRVLGAIRNDIKLAESFAAGLPARLYAPSSRGAQDYAALAVCLTQLVGE